jgi:hypothetical protein
MGGLTPSCLRAIQAFYFILPTCMPRAPPHGRRTGPLFPIPLPVMNNSFSDPILAHHHRAIKMVTDSLLPERRSETRPGVPPEITAPPAESSVFRVSYVDTVVRETFVTASDENEAEVIVEQQIADAEHHHAIDTYHDDMQTERATGSSARTCFECGRRCNESS